MPIVKHAGIERTWFVHLYWLLPSISVALLGTGCLPAEHEIDWDITGGPGAPRVAADGDLSMADRPTSAAPDSQTPPVSTPSTTAPSSGCSAVASCVDAGTTPNAPAPDCAVSSDCDDANPCTTDACDAGACTHGIAPSGTACVDGNACSTGDHCEAGTCVATHHLACAASVTVQGGRVPFEAVVSVSDVPSDATVEWLVDGVPAASGASSTILIETGGAHPVVARIQSALEAFDALPITVWGSHSVPLVSAPVGSLGATLSLQNERALRFDGAELIIPPGALNADTQIELHEWRDLQLPGLPADGHVLELLPHGTTFSTPASLWLPLGTTEEQLPCAEVANHVGGFFSGTQLEQLPVAEVDCASRRARIELHHFSFDSFVERAFDWTEKGLRGTCEYGGDLAAPIEYGCEVFGKYADIYDDTTGAISIAKKQIQLTKTGTDVIEAYISGPALGAAEIDAVLGELVDPARPSVSVNLDSALAQASFSLQLAQLLQHGTQDRVADLQLALEALRWYRAEEKRADFALEFTLALVQKAMAAPALQIIGPLISAQVKTAFDVVRRWDARAIRQQYDYYVQGRREGMIQWSKATAEPRVPEGDELYEIGYGRGTSDLTGWFVILGAGAQPHKGDDYHWKVFEILYQLQSTPISTLEAAVGQLATEISNRVSRRRLETAVGWAWNVSNNRNSTVITGGERERELHVSMLSGDTLRLDLSQSAGVPSDMVAILRSGAPDFGTILQRSQYAGRQNQLEVRPASPGNYRYDVTAIVDGVGYRLLTFVQVVPGSPPVITLVSPADGRPLWAATPFDIRLEAVDPDNHPLSFEGATIANAAGSVLSSWHDGTSGWTARLWHELTLPAGQYVLEARASDLQGDVTTLRRDLHVTACSFPGGCECEDACPAAQARACASGQVRQCQLSALGCLAWGDPSACQSGQCADGETCTGCASCESAHAECGPLDDGCGATLDCGPCDLGESCGAGGVPNQCAPCENTCPSIGATSCSAGILAECVQDAEGCLDWAAGTSCASGSCANATNCQPEPPQCPASCIPSDGCCPAGCSRAVDDDCPASIDIISPPGDERWKNGSTYQVRWTSSGVDAPLRLFVQRGGAEQTPQIAASAPAIGTQAFTVPDEWPAGSDYRLCASAFSGALLTCGDAFSVAAAGPPNPTTRCVDLNPGFLCIDGCTEPDGCPVCGDGRCWDAETFAECPADCAPGCGDGNCSEDENVGNCPRDCAFCPTACSAVINWSCGQWRNSCGQIISCGECSLPEVCGGSGQINTCGVVDGVGAWSWMPGIGGNRTGHGAAASNGVLYLTGGVSSQAMGYSDVQMLRLLEDGRPEAPTPATPLPTIRYGHTSFIHSNRLYLVAGYDGSASAASTLFAPIQPDGTLGAWIATTPTPLALHAPGVAVHGDFAYVAGGTGPGTAKQRGVYRATIAADGTLGSWSTMALLPANRSHLPLVATDGHLFAIGGANDLGAAVATVYATAIASDGSLGAWSQLPSLPQPTAGAAALAAKGSIYVFGGSEAGVILAPVSGSTLGPWRTTTPLLGARSDAPIAQHGSFVYYTGGNGNHHGSIPNDILWAPF